ncbi:MAG: hypothetical protein ACTHKK_04675 [Candidatus Nitrosocosmicus sp.]
MQRILFYLYLIANDNNIPDEIYGLKKEKKEFDSEKFLVHSNDLGDVNF